MRSKLMKITCIFFVLMICFTVLSRAADQAGIAVVTTQRPDNMMISHTVKTTGKIVQNQELAVTTEPDQRVTAIYVSEGQRVSKGDLLFEMDMTLLEEKILAGQQEMEKQKLQVQDAKSQKEVSAQQKANEQAQASEQYSLTTGKAGVQVSRAKKQLDEAKSALSKFRKNSGSTSGDSTVEESLEKACEEKQEAYLQAEQELTSLQWKIENEVDTALQRLKSQANLVLNDTVLSQSAQEIEEQGGEILSDSTPSGGLGDGTSGYGEEMQGIYATSPIAEPDVTLQSGEGDIILEEVEEIAPVSGGQGQTELSGVGASGTLNQEDGVSSGDGYQFDGAEILAPDGTYGASSVTQEELDKAEKAVRDSYAQELSGAKAKVQTALEEKQAAETALAQYQQERLAASESEDAQTEQQLIANVKTAQEAYEDAVLAANEAAVTSGRAVQTAGIPDASNSSDRVNEITYEQMELALKKLETLKQEEGKIYAPADGLVTKINILTGEKTTDTTAIMMADLSKGYRFTGQISKEQEKYIGVGDQVTLSDSSGKRKLENLPVESVTADEEDESVYYVTVQIPDDTLELGASATLEFVRKSETYSTCVPLSALHLDDKNQAYVLVTEEYDSIMGAETKARKVSVTVLEKNETNAALSEGAITSQQQIIVSSDKAVDDGSRVRISS